MEVKIYNTMLLFYCIEAVILGFSQVSKTWEYHISGSFRLFEITMHMYFPKFWLIYLKAGNKLGDGRDMM